MVKVETAKALENGAMISVRAAAISAVFFLLSCYSMHVQLNRGRYGDTRQKS